jgi:hypothetical protein
VIAKEMQKGIGNHRQLTQTKLFFTGRRIKMRRAKEIISRSILTRLKPNVYGEKHPFWKQLESGLLKMNIEQINALEGLIMGQTLRQAGKQKEMFEDKN